MEKIFNQKSFKYFVWTLLGSRVSMYVDKFFSSSKQSDIVPFAAGVIDTGEKFATVLLIPVEHLDLQISPRISPPYVIFRGL